MDRTDSRCRLREILTPGASTPNFSTINEAYTGGNSNYNSLQLAANRRFVKGITVNLNYTWSKALDYESLDRNASLPQNPLNLRPEYGPADFDHRQVFFATFIAEIPLPGKTGLVSKFTQGWQVNGIFRYISGNVLTVNPGVDTVLNGDAVANERVNMLGSPVLSAGAAFNQLYLNTASFVKAPLGSVWERGPKRLQRTRQLELRRILLQDDADHRASEVGISLRGVQRSKPSSIWGPEHNSQRGYVRENYHGSDSIDGNRSAGPADGAEAHFLGRKNRHV